MNELATSSRLAANDLRRAEHSIVKATRDTAQFLVTALDISEAQSLSPGLGHPTVRATVSALTALVESQNQLGVRAHLHIEKAGTALGPTVTDWGAGDPKVPPTLIEPERSAA